MKKRVFGSILLVSLLSLLLTSVLIISALYYDFTTVRKQELADQCELLSAVLINNNMETLNQIGQKSRDRITLIAQDGRVLYDNFTDAASLENHLDRPEVAAALQNGSGEATRLSDTLGENTYYYAIKLDNGTVLRVSAAMKNILGILNQSLGLIIPIVLIEVIIAVIAAQVLTKAIVSPINKLNLDAPLSNDSYEELSPLLVRMDKQNQKITEQLSKLELKQTEFDSIIENMSEALVIFGENHRLLMANRSAKVLFGAAQHGMGYLEICRDIAYIRAVERAFSGKPASDKLYRNGRIYQLSVNPVAAGPSFAAVLFAVDITEKEQSEKIRREFSANVSHELKTPLTSIMGYAEIMQNGIANQEDFPRFIGQIYTESKRLLTLIEDIIKLSKLDEDGLKKEFAPVDIYEVSKTVVKELTPKALDHQISLSLEGIPAEISGIEGTLHEMVYNLCDNAITYNQPGGSVKIQIVKYPSSILLSVKDSGIGIAPEHHSRIFERFYRVDKSRSKERGGTGLGLSIVKHGAMLHNAEIKLESMPGKGTEITLIFSSANVI